MWKVVYIAHSKTIAEKLEQQLARAGVLVKIRPLGNAAISLQFEVLVPESEIEEAQEVLNALV